MKITIDNFLQSVCSETIFNNFNFNSILKVSFYLLDQLGECHGYLVLTRVGIRLGLNGFVNG